MPFVTHTRLGIRPSPADITDVPLAAFSLAKEEPVLQHRRHSYRRSAFPFASISMASSQPVADPLDPVEPATGVSFPQTYCHQTSQNCPKLVGFGARSKRIIGIKNINVYALGFYADPRALKEVLGPAYKEVSAASLASNQDFLNDVVRSSQIEKTLRLVMTFGIKSSQFWHAMEERLAKPLAQAGETEALQKFGKQFDNVAFHKGLPLCFSSELNGGLTTSIDGKKVGTISSPALCEALFDVYVGPNPISESAKQSISKGLAEALSATLPVI